MSFAISGVGAASYGYYGGYNIPAAGATGVASAGAVGDPRSVDKVQGSGECQTCKNRKYQDGSDENVSFKTAAHISPQASGARVRAHEQEHVSNAYTKASQAGGKVVRAAVSIKTAVCPECGRTYVAGGTTSTLIKYPNESNPYQKNLKSADRALFSGMNFDAAI